MARAGLIIVFLGCCQSGSARVLNEEPRIELRTNFLSTSQASALRSLADSAGLQANDEASKQTNGGEDFLVLDGGREVPSKAAEVGWAAARAFEEAAAAWAELPQGTAASVVSRWEPWSPGSHLNRSGLLHLDARLRPGNQRTVLAFLSGSTSNQEAGRVTDGGIEDGLLVFPCLETDDMEPEEAARRRKLCSRAHRFIGHAHDKLMARHEEGLALPPSEQYAFLEAHPELVSLPKAEADGSRPIDWQWNAAHDDAASLEQVVGHRTRPGSSLFALAEAMCRGKAQGLRLAPVQGTAVLIEGASPSRKRGKQLVPDWNLWHAGCSPLGSSGQRWTVQLFLDGAVQGGSGKTSRKERRSAEKTEEEEL